MMDSTMHFTFSDTIAGYGRRLQGRRGRRSRCGRSTAASSRSSSRRRRSPRSIRNLGEAYVDARAPMRDMLDRGRYAVRVRHLLPRGRRHDVRGASTSSSSAAPRTSSRSSARTGGSTRSARSRTSTSDAQFPDGNIDYAQLPHAAHPRGREDADGTRQETDTISRMVYGFASAYLLTGEDRFLEAAEKGTEYLREHMRTVDAGEGIVYWYHGDRRLAARRRGRSSPRSSATTTTRSRRTSRSTRSPARSRPTAITGDPRIRERHRHDASSSSTASSSTARAAATSRTSTRSRSTRAASRSATTRARKNWNSVGDHAPAYLINLVPGDRRATTHADFLESTRRTRSQTHFPDYENSPFVQEKFHEDWSPRPRVGLAAEPRASSATT